MEAARLWDGLFFITCIHSQRTPNEGPAKKELNYIMVIERLDGCFSVCKLPDFSLVDWSDPFLFLARTDTEYSLVCSAGRAPANACCCEHGWRALRVAGTLDFSLTGVLSMLTALLAAAQIPVFAVSTYDTDYILTRAADFDRAICTLAGGGCTIV